MEQHLVQVVSTTDNKYIGAVVPLPKLGEVVDYGATRFHCNGMLTMPNGNIKTWNDNYVIVAKYVGTIEVN